MDDRLVPDTPAGQRSDETLEEMQEPSCCSPIRSKLNTTPIKLFCVVYMVCGVLSIGLGIVACIFGCLYNGLSIPAGAAFIATGVVGMCVRKHGALSVVYGWFNLFSFLFGIALLVFMLIALPEGEYSRTCSSYDCYQSYNYSGYKNCCVDWINSLTWKNVAVDLAILVVGVVVMVNSLLATTLSLRDVNWVTVCCLKKNMREQQPAIDSAQTTGAATSDGRSTQSDQSPAMKRCWKPCDSKGHHNATIVLSVIHIIIGIISVGLGIVAVFVGCRFAHIGISIWTGILIFMVTGIYGLLSASKKGSYIPCFFALSILAFFLSINMFSWAAVNITEERECKFGCVKWGCNGTSNDVKLLSIYSPGCQRCFPDCCYNGDICDHEKESIRICVDAFTIIFGVLEMLICMVTFGLSFSQLSCYTCWRNWNPTCCCPSNTNGQYQMVMTSDGNLMMVAVPNAQRGMPTMVHNQPMMYQPMMSPPNQLIGAHNQTTAIQGSPAMATLQLTSEAGYHNVQVAQGQPMFIQGNGQLMMVGGQGQPMVVGGQGQPMVVGGQVQPMMVQEQGQQMFVQQQGQPMMVQGQPMMAQGQPMMAQGQPMMVQGQPIVQGMGQVATVQGQGQPTAQPVVVPAQATGELAAGGEAKQEIGNVPNPAV